MVLALLGSPIQAADKLGNSLDVVPADASFYSTSLRLKEQFEIVRDSNAWKRLQDMPAVKMGWALFQLQANQAGGPWETVEGLLELPENQQLLELVQDMVSNEIFVYGDPSAARVAGILFEAYGATRVNNLFSAIDQAKEGGGPPKRQQDRQTARAALEVLSSHRDDLSMPNVVMGFKLSQKEPAVTQIKRLEVLAKMALKQSPLPKQSLKRVKVGGVEYLSLALDASMVPWEELPWSDLEDKEDEFAPLIEKLRGLTLNISLGVKGEYLLASIGASNEHLAKVGIGTTLAERPELKPVLAMAKKRLTSIAYASQELRRAVGTTKRDLDNLTVIAGAVMGEFPLDEPLRQRIMRDVTGLVDDIKQYIPDLGPAASCSFMTERGSEAYSYDWTPNLVLDASQPLTLMDHLGGNPLMAFVARAKHDPKQWDVMVKWLKVGYGYFEEFAVPQLDAQQKANYDRFAEIAFPLLKKFESTTREKLMPALADGQSALVLDAKITSQRWQKQMPRSSRPLPMIEPALVVGVSDPKLLESAIADYRSIVMQVIAEVGKANPGSIPPGFELPPPKQTKLKAGGSLYSYALPPEAGLDPQLVPNAGLGKTVAVLTIAPAQSEALLANQPLELPKALGSAKRPLACVAWFNWAGTLDAVRPWIDYGFDVAQQQQSRAVADDDDEEDEDEDEGKKAEDEEEDEEAAEQMSAKVKLDPNQQFILDQIHYALDILKTMRGYASVSYLENGAIVVHSETHFEDLE